MATIQNINDQLDEVSNSFGTHTFNLFIRPELDQTLRNQPERLIKMYNDSNGTPVWIYTICFNRGSDLLESGKFHTGKGVLNSDGNQILKILEYSCDKIVFYGKFDKNKMSENLNIVKSNINSLGGPSGQSKGGCYIATMVYGSYEAEEVLVLRNFRDTVLEKTILGRLFIRAYYYLSPKLVLVLEDKTKINLILRKMLDKLVSLVNNKRS